MKSRSISTKESASYSIPGPQFAQKSTLDRSNAGSNACEDYKSCVSEELDKLDNVIEAMLKVAYYVKDKLAPVLSTVESNNGKISSGPASTSPLVITLAGLREKLESAHDILEDTTRRLDI